MPPVKLGAIIGGGFLLLLIFRPILIHVFFMGVVEPKQPFRIFLLDLIICTLAGILVSAYNFTVFGFTTSSGFALVTGCVLAGFFIGLDTSLFWERTVILKATEENIVLPIKQKYFPMTRKFTYVAIILTLFISLVLILVFSRDIMWLVMVGDAPADIVAAQRSVTIEIVFIMSVLTLLIVNIIFAYSKNLKLLFNNQTRILEQVSRGILSTKVPIATFDEFGVIAGHTNDMIDGLRHRLELMTSLQIASEVQQNLLPITKPPLPGYDISGTSLYCDQIGGDYYDFLPLPNKRLGVVVADVCGHGVSAAMLMMSVRAFLHSNLERYSNPYQLISETNRHLYRDCSKNGQFTTMFLLELSPGKDMHRWIRAGHEPPILYSRETDSFARLDGRGIVLGIDPDYSFVEHDDLKIGKGDILLIGTDGIHETRNEAGEMFGLERIYEVILNNYQANAQSIQERLVAELAKFRGTMSPEDDITMVVVKVV